jgi:hypothetical protein
MTVLVCRIERSVRGGMYNLIRQKRVFTKIVNIYLVLSTLEVLPLELYAH